MNIIIVVFSLLVAVYILLSMRKNTVVHHVTRVNKENVYVEPIQVVCDCRQKSYANYTPYVGVHNYLKEGVELDTPFNTGALGVVGEKCMHEAMALVDCYDCAMKMCTIPGSISGKI